MSTDSIQASISSDEERRQLANEFRDPETTESRRAVIAKQLLQDIIQKECPRLIARSRNGEQLSDRELALLCYNGDIDEDLQTKLFETQISEHAERYASEHLQERVAKQVALHVIKEGATKVAAESAIQTAVQASAKAGITLAKGFFDAQKALWKINFVACGLMLLADLGHALWVYWRKGEITEKGLIKRMTGSLAATVSSLSLSYLGGVIGSAIGPIGTLLGGLIGALLGKFMNDKLWEFFDGTNEEKAREELLANARKVLGVVKADDFKTITRQWRKMVLESHPDKHPNADEEEKKAFGIKFQEIHIAYNIIREETKRQGKLQQSEIEEITKSTAILVINDGWSDDYVSNLEMYKLDYNNSFYRNDH